MKDRQTVLVVDDDARNLKLLCDALVGEHRVVFAKDGLSALEVAGRELPDLVILDVMMPGLDGYQVLERLKADPETRDIPVVFLTAKDRERDEKKGLELGAIDYWTKPFSLDIARARARNHLELKRSRDALADLATRDGLTGIANRRGFDEIMDREWRRCTRSGSPLSLVLIDIDHFKPFNDTYGHGAGDDCLRRVAGILEEGLERAADRAARYGGEEFACILPETGTRGALEIANRLRAAVQTTEIRHKGNPSSGIVTISAGVATRIPSQEASWQDLAERADRALYAAKEGGRNRVVAD